MTTAMMMMHAAVVVVFVTTATLLLLVPMAECFVWKSKNPISFQHQRKGTMIDFHPASMPLTIKRKGGGGGAENHCHYKTIHTRRFIFEEIGKFFEDLGKNNTTRLSFSSSSSKKGGNSFYEDAEEEEDNSVGVTRILQIPVDGIKVGGLRLYLSLYLMGQQNTPDPKTWRTSQTGDATIDVCFHDCTGVLLVELSEQNGIVLSRLGSTPSTQYLMQESAIVQGLLDEMQSIASEGDIPDSDRLLLLPPPGNAIQLAQESLSFS